MACSPKLGVGFTPKLGVGLAAAEAKTIPGQGDFMGLNQDVAAAIRKTFSFDDWATDTAQTLTQEVATAVAKTLEPVLHRFSDPANCIADPPIPQVCAYLLCISAWPDMMRW